MSKYLRLHAVAILSCLAISEVAHGDDCGAIDKFIEQKVTRSMPIDQRETTRMRTSFLNDEESIIRPGLPGAKFCVLNTYKSSYDVDCYWFSETLTEAKKIFVEIFNELRQCAKKIGFDIVDDDSHPENRGGVIRYLSTKSGEISFTYDVNRHGEERSRPYGRNVGILSIYSR